MRFTCLDCAKVFKRNDGIKRHMLVTHEKQNFEAEEENYLDLPPTQSTMYRCFPCNRTFSKLHYRLHLHQRHGSPKGVMEPPVNYDPVRISFHEEMTKPMICMTCSKRLTDPHALRRQMLEVHVVASRTRIVLEYTCTR